MNIIRVVLIEKHDSSRAGLVAALQMSEGIKVVGDAASGQKGLNIVQTTQPDVAIVALNLPDMDGVELTQKLKQLNGDREYKQTKVLVLTTKDSEDTVIAAFSAGADSYSLKDVSFSNLLQAIEVTNEGNNWIDPAIASVVINQAQETSDSNYPTSQPLIKLNEMDCAPGGDGIIQIDPLTERELEVLQLIVSGCSNAQIADKLYITIGTVKTHVRSILNKLCANDRTQAAVRALRAGLVS
ncbi:MULTISPECIES: response regulator transcription factor [unclassified Okeania]|uniref:response regulator n=1 Tax=unclassified Okeania TaxID=2634635 RepID=UPI0013BB5AF7|nr:MULTISPECIES: response regulator transcription factor [unclassified Okeania]NET16333.1 response regulator transcription factor [Okeania sp. SIO1H6]NES76894.1 response regulator transcription factor [Okeania sp. SIO1H4]NES89174.1 response regulator transcription factor [Okeania sp. SIO2B9]NET20523.1 response regulator transcription factor [Okeania sp. SIO1H5]NET78696.1 response regulator transcription factor [Okeania sp. SIO1F9]